VRLHLPRYSDKKNPPANPPSPHLLVVRSDQTSLGASEERNPEFYGRRRNEQPCWRDRSSVFSIYAGDTAARTRQPLLYFLNDPKSCGMISLKRSWHRRSGTEPLYVRQPSGQELLFQCAARGMRPPPMKVLAFPTSLSQCPFSLGATVYRWRYRILFPPHKELFHSSSRARRPSVGA